MVSREQRKGGQRGAEGMLLVVRGRLWVVMVMLWLDRVKRTMRQIWSLPLVELLPLQLVQQVQQPSSSPVPPQRAVLLHPLPAFPLLASYFQPSASPVVQSNRQPGDPA